jgi:hypothetical protein
MPSQYKAIGRVLLLMQKECQSNKITPNILTFTSNKSGVTKAKSRVTQNIDLVMLSIGHVI